MKITVAHARGFIGTNLTIQIQADEKEHIGSVSVTFDGDSLENTELGPSTDSYSREFQGVGDAGPNVNHSVVVTVIDQAGQNHTSITRWTDSM